MTQKLQLGSGPVQKKVDKSQSRVILKTDLHCPLLVIWRTDRVGQIHNEILYIKRSFHRLSVTVKLQFLHFVPTLNY